LVKTRAIKEIQFTKSFWKPAKSPRRYCDNEGWDTETYPDWLHGGPRCGCDREHVCKEHDRKGCAECCPKRKPCALRGRTFLLSHHDGVNSHLTFIDSAESLLRVFFQPGNRSLHWFYNLEFDVEGMLKWFGQSKFFAVLSESEKPVHLMHGIHAKYAPKKCLMLGELKEDGTFNNPMRCFDSAQFYDRQPLRKVAPIVGMKKLDEESLVDFERWKRDAAYQQRYNQYAIVDAVICQKLAHKFYNDVQQVVRCNTFFSTASIGKQFILSKAIDANCKLPQLVNQWALLATSGARIETGMRGTFERAWKIDLVSAYPSVTVGLPSVENMEWRKVDDMHHDAHYGFYCVSTRTYDEKFALLPVKNEDLITYPIGERKYEFITKPELELLRKRGFKVVVHGGIEGHTDEPIYPFECVREIFNKRAECKRKMKQLEKEGLKDSAEYTTFDALQHVLKIIMNSIYGCFLQITPVTNCVAWTEQLDIDDIVVTSIFDEDMNEMCKVWADIPYRAGQMFAPVYASNILSTTRGKLYDSTYRYKLEDHVIFSATDAMALDIKPNKVPLSKDLGGWDMDLDDERLTVVGSGVYRYTKDGDVKTFTRGFKKKKHEPKECRWCKRGLQCRAFDLDNITDVTTKFIAHKPVHAASAFRQNRFDDINSFQDDERTLNINFDRKRKWHDKFRSARDLFARQIDSDPLEI
jgi:hypothetical protein